MNSILKNRRINLFIALMSLLLLLTMIQNTYAKYVSSASADTNFAVATWAFSVNHQDVLRNSNFSNTISPVFINNDNIKQGVIAPTSEGYFDLLIDASGTDVSFTETITVANSANNRISDLKITGYQMNGGDLVEFTGATNVISTDHLLSDNNKVTSYRIYIQWYDGEGENMNNAADTQASRNETAKVNVNIGFIQKAN